MAFGNSVLLVLIGVLIGALIMFFVFRNNRELDKKAKEYAESQLKAAKSRIDELQNRVDSGEAKG